MPGESTGREEWRSGRSGKGRKGVASEKPAVPGAKGRALPGGGKGQCVQPAEKSESIYHYQKLRTLFPKII